MLAPRSRRRVLADAETRRTRQVRFDGDADRVIERCGEWATVRRFVRLTWASMRRRQYPADSGEYDCHAGRF